MSWFRTEISINLNADGSPIVFTLGQVFLVFLLLCSLGLSYYFYTRYDALADREAEAKRLVRAVGAHIILPDTEAPTIATVTDPKALEGQEFFVRAEAGDKVLVYPEWKKAILYRPNQDILVEVGPFVMPEVPPDGTL